MKSKIKFKIKILPSGAWEVSQKVRELVNSNFKDPDAAVFVDMIFEKQKKVRSYSLLQYYWAVTIPLIMCGMIDAGNENIHLDDKDHRKLIHEFLKKRFLKNGIEFIVEDEVHTTPSSTGLCNNVEFMKYLNECAAWSLEFLGVNIPLPNEKMQVSDTDIMDIKDYINKKRIEFNGRN